MWIGLMSNEKLILGLYVWVCLFVCVCVCVCALSRVMIGAEVKQTYHVNWIRKGRDLVYREWCIPGFLCQSSHQNSSRFYCVNWVLIGVVYACRESCGLDKLERSKFGCVFYFQGSDLKLNVQTLLKLVMAIMWLLYTPFTLQKLHHYAELGQSYRSVYM